MRQIALNIWRGFTGNLLGIPVMVTVLLGLLAVVLIQFGDDVAPGGSWVFDGDADGARAVLSAIVTALITVAGLVIATRALSTSLEPRGSRRIDAAIQSSPSRIDSGGA